MAQAPVIPPPPTTETPDTFGKQLKQRKKSRFWRNLGLLCLLVIGAGVGYGVFTQKGRETADTVVQVGKTYLVVKQDPDLIFTNVGSDHVNILLIGEDRNWKETTVFNPKLGRKVRWHEIDRDTPPRADTMIVVSLDKLSGKIRMLSFPRDTTVRWRDDEGRRHKTKMNAVYAAGGRDQTARQDFLKRFLLNEMGLRIDRVANIKLEGFTKLVDQVNGVYVDVDGALMRNRRTGKFYRGNIDYKDNYGQWEVHLKPGKQWLNGDQAHGYVRFRKDFIGDPGRIKRQQQVMQALARRIMEQPFWKLPDIAKEVRQQFNADLSDEEMASAALFAKNRGGGLKISPVTPFGIYESDGDVRMNQPENVKLFTTIFGSSFDPNHFLVRSPSTERDEIGRLNNTAPAAQEVLREAGLLKKDEKLESFADAPVKTE